MAVHAYDCFLHPFISGQVHRILINGNTAARRDPVGQVAIYVNVWGHRHQGVMLRLCKALEVGGVDYALLSGKIDSGVELDENNEIIGEVNHGI
jgi:hypothetical protein